MKTIAVTGASGFVGRHVLNAIAIAGHRSIALSRRPVQADRSEWIHLDLSNPDPSTIRAIAAADSVIHLAWGGLPNYRSAIHLEIELPRQIAFVEHLVKGGVRSLIVSGTCLEYGNQEGECSEKVDPTPVIPYAQAKDRLRRHLEQMRELTPFALCWCRLFYMYGHGQPAHSLWQQLHNKAIAGERWFPMSGGQQIRDFLPVEEVARRLALMAVTNANADVVNICSGIPITVEQVVRTWIRNHGWTIELGLGQFPYLDYEPFAFWGSAEHWHQVELNAKTVLSRHDES